MQWCKELFTSDKNTVNILIPKELLTSDKNTANSPVPQKVVDYPFEMVQAILWKY